VDVEAVRVCPQVFAGAKQVLYGSVEAIQITGRYSPSSSRLAFRRSRRDGWRDLEPGGRRARGGVDVRGGTAWGLLGLYEWSHLCTRGAARTKPGVFDMSSGRPLEHLLRKW